MENDTLSKGNIAKKILKIVLKILYQILIILCIILTIIIILQKLTNSGQSLFGFRIFRVLTGSMNPEYEVGQVVISTEVLTNEINVGDDIVYLGTYGDYNGKIIMHKVVAIDKDENNNNINFHAKGLHSMSVEDPQVKPNQVFGVVVHKSKILTVLYNLATNIYSAFIIIVVLAANVFLSFKGSTERKIHQLAEHYEGMDAEERIEDEENIEYSAEDDVEDDVEEDVETEKEIEEDK